MEEGEDTDRQTRETNGEEGGAIEEVSIMQRQQEEGL